MAKTRKMFFGVPPGTADPQSCHKTARVFLLCEVLTVKANITGQRIFGNERHYRRGYILVVALDEKKSDGTPKRVAVSAAAHEKHRFRIGDIFSCEAVSALNRREEWADYHLCEEHSFAFHFRGSECEERPADSNGGIASSLHDYHLRARKRIDVRAAKRCFSCSWGVTVPVVTITDQWKPKKKFSVEKYCFGPRGCERYKAPKSDVAARLEPGTATVNKFQ